jgi:amyloid beta precursor protein binding protein 1
MVYVALLGAAEFKELHKRFATKDDVEELTKITSSIREQRYPDMLPIEKEVIQEVARVQGAELISISAIMGNIVAQEAVKLITHQFTPLNSGYFFDGVVGVGTATEL